MRFRVRHWLLLPIASLLVSECSTQFSDTPITGEELATSTTLANLNKSVIDDEVLHFEEDIVVAGRVTSSDQARNFYRSIILEADGAAIELMAGQERLYNDYPIGSKLYIRLQGLVAARRYGILQIGSKPNAGSYYAVDYLGSKVALDQHVVRASAPLGELIPITVSLDQLTPTLCGRLVCIEGLRYLPESNSEGIIEPNCWQGYRRFTDREGGIIYTYVRTYADFAEEPIPSGERKLIGILQYDAAGAGRYSIKLRDEADFKN